MADSPQPFTAINPTDPPDVKIAKVEAQGRVSLATAVAGGLADLAGIVALTLLVALRVVPVEPWLWIVVALATGTTLGRLRGKRGVGGGTLGLLVSIGQQIAEHSRHV